MVMVGKIFVHYLILWCWGLLKSQRFLICMCLVYSEWEELESHVNRNWWIFEVAKCHRKQIAFLEKNKSFFRQLHEKSRGSKYPIERGRRKTYNQTAPFQVRNASCVQILTREKWKTKKEKGVWDQKMVKIYSIHCGNDVLRKSVI